MISLLVAALLAQQPVPSVSVLPATEAQVVFTHVGYSYVVGKESGKVVATLVGSDVSPDGLQPKPPPVTPDVAGVKWFSLIIDETKPEQQSWRTDLQIRGALGSRGIQYRSYLAGEADINTLGFQSVVGQIGLPAVILQDQSGKVVKSTSAKSKDEIIKLIEVIK